MILDDDRLSRELFRRSEIERLKSRLAQIFDKISLVLDYTDPPEMLCEHFAQQVLWGRTVPLSRDLALTRSRDWVASALATHGKCLPHLNIFPEIEAAPHWLHHQNLIEDWRQVFGPAALQQDYADLPAPILAALDAKTPPPLQPSSVFLGRALLVNRLLRSEMARGLALPRKLRARAMGMIDLPGKPLDPKLLRPILSHINRNRPCPTPRLHDLGALEPKPDPDFDPGPVLAKMRPLMADAAAKERLDSGPLLSGAADRLFSQPSKKTFETFAKSRFAPNNRLSAADIVKTPPPLNGRSQRQIDRAERVIIACMKDEGPYILEWLAFHRSIGFDHFVIYTNDCQDPTADILDHLAKSGWVTHIDNSNWHGQSPQQAALNKAIKLPVIRDSTWILHIDVDEFANIRHGAGILDNLLDQMPEASNIALTWRLFGNNGVDHLAQRKVIDQFTRCAPSYCPKPHTAWGFKTLTKNLGIYGKLSCHRPTKPALDRLDELHWFNGSGQPMGREVAMKGWRSNLRTIGYDLVQLNHYALRSRDSFLIKRQRGRALHVDRKIGANYWARMDWNDHVDLSIQRHLPRLRAEMQGLLVDLKLRDLHEQAFDWHQKTAKRLRQEPEFARLIEDIGQINFNQTERAAYAMALDMNS
ncbi:MAG: glycosyltransferase family 2 protein [Mangrovicoccus sp.]